MDLFEFINEMGKNIPEGGHKAWRWESVMLKTHPACSWEEAEGKEARLGTVSNTEELHTSP